MQRDAEPGVVLHGAQVHNADSGVRAQQHTPGINLCHGGRPQDGDSEARDALRAGQGFGHRRVRRRFHDHALLQGFATKGVGIPDALALRGARD